MKEGHFPITDWFDACNWKPKVELVTEHHFGCLLLLNFTSSCGILHHKCEKYLM